MPLDTNSVGIPDRFDIDDAAGVLRIRWAWPKVVGVILAIFAASWDGFLIVWYFNAMSRDGSFLFELLFPIGHLAVGLVMPYAALAFLFNTTAVEVEAGEIRVRHRPLPWPGNRTFRVTDVRQLFCVQRESQKGSQTYDVMARLASDRETTLVSGLTDEREARFIEQRIEGRLGLADRPIAGELTR